MSPQLTAPALDSSAVLNRWLVKPGDTVAAGQPIAIVVTATQELVLPAGAAGMVADILIVEGAPVAGNSDLLLFAADHGVGNGAPRRRATPLARRIAAAAGIDLQSVTGSGIGGVVSKRDVLPLVEGPGRAPEGGFCVAEQMGNSLAAERPIVLPPRESHAPPPAPAAPTADPRRPRLVAFGDAPRAGDRWSVAAAERSNATIPQAIVAATLDMAAIEAAVRERGPALARRGIALDATACLALACLRALGRERRLLADWADEEIIRRAEFHLAVVTAAGSRLLPHAADLSLQGIARALGAPDTHADGAGPQATCTLIHLAQGWWSAPQIAPGQAMALHVGATGSQVVAGAAPGAPDQLAIARQATATLAYDARIVSDEAAESFLAALRAEVAAPLR